MDGLKIFPKRKWKNGTKQTRRTYASWNSMLHRCYDSKTISFSYYGAKGIEVCARWRNDYDAFVEDMGLRPNGMTLDRLDNTKGYSPENCQWASVEDQNRNKRSNVKFKISGRNKTLAELAREAGVGRERAAYRLRIGLGIEKALDPENLQRASKTHGIPSTYFTGCRCELCVPVGREYARQRYAQKKIVKRSALQHDL